MAIRIPKESENQFIDLKNGIVDCIKATETTARVHNSSVMYSELESTLRALKTSDELIHAWTVEVREIDVRNMRVGGGVIEMPLNIVITGYIGFKPGKDSSSRQSILERECKDIIKILYLNKGVYGMDNPDCLATVDDNEQFLRFSDINVKGFGSKDTLLIAEGNITIVWKELIQEVIA